MTTPRQQLQNVKQPVKHVSYVGNSYHAREATEIIGKP
jgi:hypothetical protein